MKTYYSLKSIIISAACLLISVFGCNSIVKPEPQYFLSSFMDSADWGLKFLRLGGDPLSLETVYTLETGVVPAYFEFHPSKKFLYMVSSDPLPGTESGGSLHAFLLKGIDEKPELLNSVSSYGEGPCHIRFDHNGKFVFVANYFSGNFAVYPVNEDGSVGDSIQFIQFTGSSIFPGRQEAPHAHSSLLSPDNQTLYVADLGTDRVMVYNFDQETGQLSPAPHPWIETAPGAGPRHTVLHPDLQVLYVVEEISSTVGVFSTEKIGQEMPGELQRISTLPADFEGKNTIAGIRVSRDGKFVYVSNRGHNSIAVFSVDLSNGSLTEAGRQSTLGIRPRNFSLSADEKFLLAANRESDNIVVFRRDTVNGTLSETGVELIIPDPKCIKKF